MCIFPQSPEKMCLLENQNPSKTSEKMGYFDRVTVSLHILQTANQETEGSQDRLTLGVSIALRATCRAPARIWLAVIDFQKVDLGQIRSEEIVCKHQIHKDPIGLINRAKRQVQTFFIYSRKTPLDPVIFRLETQKFLKQNMPSKGLKTVYKCKQITKME